VRPRDEAETSRDARKRAGVRRTLDDLVEFGGIAQRLTARGRKHYEQDEISRLAAEAIVHRIGEAVGRLPGELTDTHPEVEWRKIRAMRNIVAHEYDRVDHEILWQALDVRVPHLTACVCAILDADGWWPPTPGIGSG
jgi:uncharacterized protein with HEPN domain